MWRAMAASGILAFASNLGFGQSAENNLTFEVASVRMAPPESLAAGIAGTQGGPGSRDPVRFTGRGQSLRQYLCIAYATADCQQQIIGPGWIDSEKYDVVANIPAGTTEEQYQKMLRYLLTERFKLVLHHETKTLPVYELVVASDGPKLRASAETPSADAPPGPTGKIEMDKNGFPVLPPGWPGLISSYGPGPFSHWTARQQPISALARSLSFSTATGRQVIDKTGLTGKYDFTLVYDMHRTDMPGGPDDGPSLIIFDALQKQLGLRLVDAKAPFNFVVIDRGEKTPVEN